MTLSKAIRHQSRLLAAHLSKIFIKPGPEFYLESIRQQEAGVYMLFLAGELQYIGQSKNVHDRIRQHTTNGRPFDESRFVIVLDRERRAELEAKLIREFNPPGNIAMTTREKAQRAADADDISDASLQEALSVILA